MLWAPRCTSSAVCWTAPPPVARLPNSQFESVPITTGHPAGAFWMVLCIQLARRVTDDFQ
eukprot:5015344-Pyramimonas_sp.AAC.2